MKKDHNLGDILERYNNLDNITDDEICYVITTIEGIMDAGLNQLGGHRYSIFVADLLVKYIQFNSWAKARKLLEDQQGD